MRPEVLVVDDDENAAKGYADLISARAKIATTYTASVSDAERLMGVTLFKVVVLDQKMPNVSGTELFKRLRTIYPAFRAVMLTGEADGEEIGRALQLGYSDYLHKSKVAELPGKILNELLKFHLDAARKDNATQEILVGFDTNWTFLKRHITKIFMVSSFILDDKFTPDDEWTTIIQVKAGETLELVDKISTIKKVRIEQSSEDKLAASLGSDKIFQIIAAKIESQLVEKYISESIAEDHSENSIKRVFSLPKEPDKPDAPHVVSRAFQRAPVYRRIQVILRIACQSCGRDELTSIMVSQATGEVATRNVDTLLRGASRVVDTGLHRFGALS